MARKATGTGMAGAISATLTALIADATRDGVRTRSMAVFGVGVGGAFMMAMIFGPLFSARFGVPALFLFAALLALVAAALLVALPAGVERPATPRHWDFRPAFRPELLRLDFYVFLLHAILTASFVALPFLLVERLELAVTDHWKMYVGALLLSLAGTIPLIMRDERQGKGSTIGIAVTLMLAGQLVLTFAGFAIAPVFGGLVLFFAGFNFLEAGLPARLVRGCQRRDPRQGGGFFVRAVRDTTACQLLTLGPGTRWPAMIEWWHGEGSERLNGDDGVVRRIPSARSLAAAPPGRLDSSLDAGWRDRGIRRRNGGSRWACRSGPAAVFHHDHCPRPGNSTPRPACRHLRRLAERA